MVRRPRMLLEERSVSLLKPHFSALTSFLSTVNVLISIAWFVQTLFKFEIQITY